MVKKEGIQFLVLDDAEKIVGRFPTQGEALHFEKGRTAIVARAIPAEKPIPEEEVFDVIPPTDPVPTAPSGSKASKRGR